MIKIKLEGQKILISVFKGENQSPVPQETALVGALTLCPSIQLDQQYTVDEGVEIFIPKLDFDLFRVLASAKLVQLEQIEQMKKGAGDRFIAKALPQEEIKRVLSGAMRFFCGAKEEAGSLSELVEKEAGNLSELVIDLGNGDRQFKEGRNFLRSASALQRAVVEELEKLKAKKPEEVKEIVMVNQRVIELERSIVKQYLEGVKLVAAAALQTEGPAEAKTCLMDLFTYRKNQTIFLASLKSLLVQKEIPYKVISHVGTILHNLISDLKNGNVCDILGITHIISLISHYAEERHCSALYILSHMYSQGDGVDKNTHAAVELLESAPSEERPAYLKRELGYLYGETKQPRNAVDAYEKVDVQSIRSCDAYVLSKAYGFLDSPLSQSYSDRNRTLTAKENRKMDEKYEREQQRYAKIKNKVCAFIECGDTESHTADGSLAKP
jgi:hypothetical protein